MRDGGMAMARINGVPLHGAQEILAVDELRRRACSELLRQAAQAGGLLADDDAATADGVLSEAAVKAIEALLDQRLPVPEPTDEECLRHYAAQRATFRTGERVRLRHILFAVTPGVDVVALRRRAESTLLEVRSRDGQAADKFADAARTLSNCPSGAVGGDLDWLTADDCAPEFAREIFGHDEVGVLPRLVHSRFGLHVVEVLQRQGGAVPPFASVRNAVAMSLRRQFHLTALRQYLRVLAVAARIEGVDLALADTPMVP